MPRKGKPLPKPPSAGGKARRSLGEEASTPLAADRIAKAIHEGTYEEFLRSELPDNEYAAKLVSIMLGMTGMAPPDNSQAEPSFPEPTGGSHVPEDLRVAAEAGNMEKTLEILQREHGKRSGGEGISLGEGEKTAPPPKAFEKKIVDELLKIAADNGVTLDWLIARALTLYVRDYAATGRL